MLPNVISSTSRSCRQFDTRRLWAASLQLSHAGTDGHEVGLLTHNAAAVSGG